MNTIYIVHRGTLDTSSQADIFRGMNAAYLDRESAKIDSEASNCNMTEFRAHTSQGRVFADPECTQEIVTFD